MKRLYITLGMLLSFSMASFAQNADVAAYLELNSYQCLNAGDEIQPYDTVTNQPYGIWGVVNMGPDLVDSGEIVWLATPTNEFVDSSMYISGYYTREAAAGDALVLLSYMSVDSIKVLMDIDAYENDTTGYFVNYMVPRQQLVDSQMYGFFVFNWGIGEDYQNPDNSDTVRSNNRTYLPIMWHCGPGGDTGEGIEDMLLAAAHNITIFPNPAQNELHFKYGFLRNTNNAVAQVIDMSGRVLLTKNLGKQPMGTYEFNMDISALPAGNYLLEISTGYINAVGKFTVND